MNRERRIDPLRFQERRGEIINELGMENMFTAAEGWGKYRKCLKMHDFKVSNKEYRGVTWSFSTRNTIVVSTTEKIQNVLVNIHSVLATKEVCKSLGKEMLCWMFLCRARCHFWVTGWRAVKSLSGGGSDLCVAQEGGYTSLLPRLSHQVELRPPKTTKQTLKVDRNRT